MSRSAIKSIQAAAGGVAADPRIATFSDVVLLMDGDGTNSANNNSINKNSGSSMSVVGTFHQGSFSPYGNNWSVAFGGSTDFIRSIATSVSVGTGDFTLECWALSNDTTQTAVLFDTRAGSANNKPVLAINGGAFAYWSTSHRITAPDAAIERVWFHVAIVRYNNTTTLYIDGEPKGTYSDSADIGSIGRYQLGADDDGSFNDYFDGYLSNVRFSATSRYTSSFTPSTSPYTNDGSTNFLACSSNRFKDNSSNNLALTAYGNPAVSPSSPFRDSNARTLTSDGGSVQFPNTGNNYLYTSQQIGTDNTFTCEGWIYMTATPTESAGLTGFWSTGDSTSNVNYGPTFGPDSNKRLRLRWWLGYGAECAATTTTMNLFEWNHICLTIYYSSIYMFVNGQQQSLSGTTSYQSPIGSSSYDTIGANSYGKFRGYISDFRLSSSSQRTSGFTPPTSPVSPFSSNKITLNFRDGNIFDLAGLNNIKTSGVELETNLKKYGTASIEFNSGGDYLEIPSNDVLALGTGDFTIESWIYLSSNTNSQGSAGGCIIDMRSSSSTGNGFLFSVTPSASNFVLNFYTDGGNNQGSTTMSYQTWYHIAVTRESGKIRLFVDGAVDATFTKANDFSDTPTVRIGYSDLYSSSSIIGNLDDFRITKGVARYISAFTPPTAALPKY